MDRKNAIARAGGRPRKKQASRSKAISLPAKTEDTQRSNRLPPGGNAVLDERVPALLLDAMSSVNAAITSAITSLPYTEARLAAATDDGEKCELTHAIQEVAEKHPKFFKQNRAPIEFGVAWAAVHAKHFDNLLARGDGTVEELACSPLQAFLLMAVILAPLLIFAFVSITQHARRV